MAGLSPTARATFTPPGEPVMLWSRIRRVSLNVSWAETYTTYYSGGETSVSTVTGSYSGAANNRIVAGQIPNTGNSDFFYFTAPMGLGPMMGADAAIEKGLIASCIGSGSQSISTSVNSGEPEPSGNTTLEYAGCGFIRSGIIGDSGQPTSESVLWTVGAAVLNGVIPPNNLVIPWDNFDDGGAWSHSWSTTEIGESNRIDLTGTFTINLIT